MAKILITGITGNVGSGVAKHLLEAGAPIRAAVPKSELALVCSRFFGLDCVAFDFEDPRTYGPAFENVDRMFLIRPPAISDVRRHINPAVDFALSCGVQHIVFLSLLGAGNNPIVPHRQIEKHILRRKAAFTFLRPSFFMQNLSGIHREDIALRSEIVIPAGYGKTSFIDCRDIAEIAALALLEPSHRYKAYPLTGGESLDYYQVANIFSNILGRPITYTRPSPGQYARRMREMGIQPEFIAVMQAIYMTVRLGLGRRVTPDAGRLLGRPPKTMREFIYDHKEAWACPAPGDRQQ